MKVGPGGNNMSTNKLQFPELGWEQSIWHMFENPKGPKIKTHSYDAPACTLIGFLFSHFSHKQCLTKKVLPPLALAGAQMSKQTFFRSQYFFMTTCQNKMNIMNEHILFQPLASITGRFCFGWKFGTELCKCSGGNLGNFMADVRNLGKNHGKNKVYVRDLGS